MVEIKLLSIKKLKFFGGDKKKFGHLILNHQTRWQKEFGHLVLDHQTRWKKNFIIKTNLIEKKLVMKKNLNIHFDRWNWCILTNINMMINIKWAHHNISNNLEIHYVLGLLIQKNYPKKHVLQNFGH
jgi:hypothetical protein